MCCRCGLSICESEGYADLESRASTHTHNTYLRWKELATKVVEAEGCRRVMDKKKSALREGMIERELCTPLLGPAWADRRRWIPR